MKRKQTLFPLRYDRGKEGAAEVRYQAQRQEVVQSSPEFSPWAGVAGGVGFWQMKYITPIILSITFVLTAVSAEKKIPETAAIKVGAS